MPSTNPRYGSWKRRDSVRKWLLATQDHCALCGKWIDKGLRTPHPMSAEVDEIIPISKGGSPYDRENVQLVHRCCNIRKGNKILPKTSENGKNEGQTQKEQFRPEMSLPLPKSRDWRV